jgi:hypothetical protein
MTTEDVPNRPTESQRETLLSVLCTKEDWTPNEVTAYKSLAFREDGVGCVSYTTVIHPASHPHVTEILSAVKTLQRPTWIPPRL